MNQNSQDNLENSKSPLMTNSNLVEASNSEPDINLIDLLIALGQEKMTLIVTTVLAAITGVIVSLVMPATFASRTIIMPSLQSSGSGGLASLGGFAGLAGLGGLSSIAGSIKSSDELYIALMRSQSVQTALIDKFNLKERYGAKTVEDARQKLNQNILIFSDKKSGLILIDAYDENPEFASQLANAQVKELNLILSRLAVTEAQQRRSYYEQQILQTQAKIPQIEMEFKEAQKRSGVEIASLVSEAGSLPGQIAAKELQLQVLSRFATSQNPEIKRIVAEISALRSQLAKYQLSKNETNPNGPSIAQSSFDKARANFVQKATQAYNTLKIQEALLDGFVRQLEVAKVDEAKEGPNVQIVDEARVPEIRAKPERRKIVFAFSITGLLISLFFASIKAFVRNAKSTAEGSARWSQLKKSWKIA